MAYLRGFFYWGEIFIGHVWPETYSLDLLRGSNNFFLEQVYANQNDWIIKNADVESHDSWGARGVMLGARYGKKVFHSALFDGESPKNKRLGARSVLQRFYKSVDFSQIWNDIVKGSIPFSDNTKILGKIRDLSVTGSPAKSHVFARIAFYLLLDNLRHKVFIPPFGIITLRQDPLAHGASDALFTAFEIA